MKKLSLYSLALFLLSGCATSGNPAVMDHAIVSQIEIGKSTKADVRRLLGDPNYSSTTQVSGQPIETWAYGYAKHETNPLIFVPVVGLFAMGTGDVATNESASFGVSFDKDGIVRSISKGKSNINVGGFATPTTIQSKHSTQGDSFKTDQQTNTQTTTP